MEEKEEAKKIEKCELIMNITCGNGCHMSACAKKRNTTNVLHIHTDACVRPCIRVIQLKIVFIHATEVGGRKTRILRKRVVHVKYKTEERARIPTKFP